MTSIDHTSKSRYGVVYPGVSFARPVVACPAYPMARHGLALDTPLLTIYHTKYSVPDCEILEIFHTRAEHES